MDLVAAAQLIFPVVCTDASLLSNCSAHVTEMLLCCSAFASLDQKSPVALLLCKMFINNRKSQNTIGTNFGSSATSLIRDWRCSVCDFSCSCVYCDFEFLKFVFSTLQSRSCSQLTNSCLLRGHAGSLLWIDILSFLFLIGIF